jgi:hypothetical protein
MLSHVGALESRHKRISRAQQNKIQVLHTFEIGHVCPYIGVQCIHNHLPVRGTCDLHSSVNQARSGRCSLPRIVLSDVLSLGQEIWKNALVELGLSDYTAFEKVLSGGIEGAVEEGEEDHSIFGEDVLVEVGDGTGNADTLED